MWQWTWLEQFAQDLRHSLRGMRKRPGFTLVAILSLAIGIGATTAVFSVLNAVALRPLAVHDPYRLVVLQPELRGQRFVLFNPMFEELRRAQRTLSGMFAVSDEPYLKAAFGGAAPSFIRGSLVSGNYFAVLGVSPALGRLLTPEDDAPGAQSCAVVISNALWKTMFQRHASVLGKTVVVRQTACTIVGVAPASFRGHEAGYAPDLWAPLQPLTDPKLLASRSMAFFTGVMGRLRPGTTRAQAEAELTGLYQNIMAANPEPSPRPGESPPSPADFRMLVRGGAQGLETLTREFVRPLALALAVVGMVLLIAGFNVANLMLARGSRPAAASSASQLPQPCL